MHPDPSSWEGHPSRLCPIRDTTQQPAIPPLEEGSAGTARSLFPLAGYAHPPAVGPARTHCRQHPLIGSPCSATPAYFPDAFAVPCRAIGPLEYSTVRSASKATRAPFLTLIAHPSCSSPHTAPLRPFLRDSTTELRGRTSTALPPPAHGSLTAGSRLGTHTPVQRYGSLWPCATLHPPAPLSSGLATGSSKSLVPAQSRPGRENVFTPLIRGSRRSARGQPTLHCMELSGLMHRHVRPMSSCLPVSHLLLRPLCLRSIAMCQYMVAAEVLYKSIHHVHYVTGC